MRSLRARLLLATVLVAAVAVGASALLSRRVVTSEFQRLERWAEPIELAPAVGAVAAHLAEGGTPERADVVLERAARPLGRALLIVDGGGRVLAASAAPLRGTRVEFMPEGRMRIEGATRIGRTASGLRLELVHPPRADLPAGRDGVLLTLLAVPEPSGAGHPATASLRTVDRGLWLGGLVAVALGAALMSLIAARIARPVAALTAAAGRMAGGDLTPRVPAHGDDEIAALARSFNAMADALARARDQRRQLTHDVAHELRTPLTSLRAQIEALQDGLLDADAAALASLHEEVALLGRLVDDLQQLAAAESGELRLQVGAVPVGEALAGAAAAFRSRAGQAGVTLEVEAPAGLAVRADPVRLGQVLRALLDNAFAHTPAGGRVALAARAAGDQVALEVADTGAGIAPEHLPHVFERFYRADPARSRGSGGAGLGLAIARQLVTLQGGTVAAASTPGAGSRFTVTLPRA